jgi:catechol 2,3-dioxygenase-like lactoylglutathione lyase family enzyme
MAPEFTHIWLLVESMPEALRFYHETLGIEIASNLGVFVELNANDHVLLSLFERGAMRSAEPNLAIDQMGGQRSVIVLSVVSVDDICDRLRGLGVELAAAETNHPEWGLRTAFLYDPDGNLLCLYSGIPEVSPA